MAITMMSTITKAIGGPTSKHFSLPHFSMFICCCWCCCCCWCHGCGSFTLPKRKKIPFDCQAKAYYSRRYWCSRNRHNTQDNTTQHIMKIAICIRWRLLFGFVFTIALELSRQREIERETENITWWTFCSVCCVAQLMHWFLWSHFTSQYLRSHLSPSPHWTRDSGSDYNCCMNRSWLPKCKFSGFHHYLTLRVYVYGRASLWTAIFFFRSISFSFHSSLDLLKPGRKKICTCTFDVVKCSKMDYYFKLGVCRISWKFHWNKSNKNKYYRTYFNGSVARRNLVNNLKFVNFKSSKEHSTDFARCQKN